MQMGGYLWGCIILYMEAIPKSIPTESTPNNRHTLQHNEYEVDVYKLITLTKELSETPIAVADYLDQLDDPCWTDDQDNRFTPRQVADIYREFGPTDGAAKYPNLKGHLQKIEQADYSHPVLIFEGKIIDGSHRFAKAFVENQTTLKARVISEMPTDAIIKLHGPE